MELITHFHGRAADYDAARPAYAPAFFQYLSGTYGIADGAVIADIGSGTGKLSRQLLERGYQVFAVEPDRDMRSMAERNLADFPGFFSVAGTAECTTLDSASADAVIAAQSFHWFRPGAFRLECRRILRPGSIAVLVWNWRDPEASVNRAWSDLSRQFCPTFQGFSNGLRPHDPRISEFFGGCYQYHFFSHPLCLDWPAFLRRCLSSSYAPRGEAPESAAYQETLFSLFNRFARQGVLEIPNATVVYTGAPG